MCIRDRGIYNGGTNAIFEDSKEQVWISQNGIYLFNEKKESTKRLAFNKGLSGIAGTFLEDDDGLIWVSTNSGLDIIDEKNSTIKHILLKGITGTEIANLLKDQNGNIWIGTSGNGLFMVNTAASTITSFTETNGLANDCLLYTSRCV